MKKKKELIQFRLEFEDYDVNYNKIQMLKIKSKKKQPTKEQIKETIDVYKTNKKWKQKEYVR